MLKPGFCASKQLSCSQWPYIRFCCLLILNGTVNCLLSSFLSSRSPPLVNSPLSLIVSTCLKSAQLIQATPPRVEDPGTTLATDKPNSYRPGTTVHHGKYSRRTPRIARPDPSWYASRDATHAMCTLPFPPLWLIKPCISAPPYHHPFTFCLHTPTLSKRFAQC